MTALKLDGGRALTEGANIVQHLADLKPQTRLAPAEFEKLEPQSSSPGVLRSPRRLRSARAA